MDRTDQEQLSDTIVAMSRYLDEDHIQTALLGICRDADIVPMLFWKSEVVADASGGEEDWDGYDMFALLHEQVYESAHQKMVERLIEKQQQRRVAEKVSVAFREKRSVAVEYPVLEIVEMSDGVPETKDSDA